MGIALVFYMWIVQGKKKIWFIFFDFWAFLLTLLFGQWINWPPTHQLASLHHPQREENSRQWEGRDWNVRQTLYLSPCIKHEQPQNITPVTFHTEVISKLMSCLLSVLGQTCLQKGFIYWSYSTDNCVITLKATHTKRINTCPYSKSFQVKLLYWFHPQLSFDIFWMTSDSNMDCDLEMILLLAHKGIICCWKIKSFVCDNVISYSRSVKTRKDSNFKYRHICIFNSHFCMD